LLLLLLLRNDSSSALSAAFADFCDACQLSALDLSDGALLDPCLDGFQGIDGIDHATQSRIRLQQITLHHVVHVVGDAGKVNIGPGELETMVYINLQMDIKGFIF